MSAENQAPSEPTPSSVAAPPPEAPPGTLPGAAIAVALLFLAYAVAFFLRNTVEMDGVRYFALFDDAFVSMRYARNLAEGFGPVWNPGERGAQGFTNPLWMAAMAAIHLVASGNEAALGVQLLCAALLTANVVGVFVLAEEVGGRRAAIVASALTAVYLPLNTWSLQGMEVALLAPLTTFAAADFVRSVRDGRLRIRPHVLMSVAVLTRLDAVVLWGGLAAGAVLARPELLRPTARWGGGLAVLSLASVLTFSQLVYGDPLPNTYYLKLGDSAFLHRASAGAAALLATATAFGPLTLLAALGWVPRGDPRLRLLAIAFFAQCLYSVYVGGDLAEWWRGANRYVATAVPLLFVLIGVGIARVSSHFSARSAAVAALLSLVVAVDANDFSDRSLSQIVLYEEALHVRDLAYLLRQAEAVEDISRPEAKVATVWAGAIPYYARRHFIDLLGKSDPVIARLEGEQVPGPSGWFQYWPGHMKWNYAHSIGTLRPDVITQLWGVEAPVAAIDLRQIPPDAAPLVARTFVRVQYRGAALLLRKGSPAIDWAKVRAGASRIDEIP